MNKVFLILLLTTFSRLQAQNSDLYDFVTRVQQTHFSSTSVYPIGSTTLINTTNKSLQGTYHIGSKVKTLTPILVFDGQVVYYGEQSEALVKNLLNSYSLNQIAGIDYWQDISHSTSVYGVLGENGVIFVYSQNYTSTNPSVRNYFKISFENGQIIEGKKKSGK